MKKTLSLIPALILAACASLPEGSPVPQVIVTPEATPTSTPPPTETPLPTLTPTPVAVDGIAENAEGDKLAFLNGEWRVLPELDAEYASMRVDENGGVVAVGADGDIAYEYDMAANNWVEVNTLPDWVRTLESAGNTVDVERGIVYDADGKVLGATGADGEWTEYPNGMVPLEAQDESGEPPLEVLYAENFEDAIALVERLPWNNPTVYRQPTNETVKRARANYDRYIAQLRQELQEQGRWILENVVLRATDRNNYSVQVDIENVLLPSGRKVTMLSYLPAYDALAESIFIDIDAVGLLEQLRGGNHDYEIVGP